MAINFRDEQEIFKLEVDATAKNNFLEMARWTKFLAVLGFVTIGLLFVLGIVISFVLSNTSLGGSQFSSLGAVGPVAFILVFLTIIGVNFYPIFALFRYSQCIKVAMNTDNKGELNNAIRHLKNMFRYIGILTIIMLAFYGFNIIITIAKLSA